MQVTILEFINLPDKPLYHLEHFIEGDYIKYNSNSGFVTDVNRKTPQVTNGVDIGIFGVL
jgi:elongation factor 2 kinase